MTGIAALVSSKSQENLPEAIEPLTSNVTSNKPNTSVHFQTQQQLDQKSIQLKPNSHQTRSDPSLEHSQTPTDLFNPFARERNASETRHDTVCFLAEAKHNLKMVSVYSSGYESLTGSLKNLEIRKVFLYLDSGEEGNMNICKK